MQRKYITGQGRGNSGYGLAEETHLYEVISDPAPPNYRETYRPMCSRGFNRSFGTGFSIWRGNVGDSGVCQVCEAREAKQLPGMSWKLPRKLKKKITKRILAWKNYSPLLPGLPMESPKEYFGERGRPDAE